MLVFFMLYPPVPAVENAETMLSKGAYLPQLKIVFLQWLKRHILNTIIFAVDFTLGTNFPTKGPGASAFIIYIERSPPIGIIASKNTSTPIPPIQCVKLLQNNIERGNPSISVSMLAPVVVKPDTVSKKTVYKRRYCFRKIKGIAPKKIIQSKKVL